MNHEIRMTARKISRYLKLIEPLQHRKKSQLTPLRYLELDSPIENPPLDPNPNDHRWQEIPPGAFWGGQNINFVMYGEFTVPPYFERDVPIALFLPLGNAGEFSHPECLVYFDGTPYAAVDRHHQEIWIPASFCDDKLHKLALHGWTGFMGGIENAPYKRLQMRPCMVVSIDMPTRALVAAARTALEAANLLDELEPAKTRLYNALDSAFLSLDTREPLGDSFYASVPTALQVLREGIAAAGPSMDAEIVAAGHAHIDVAWLWTLGQTRRKSGRTFYTVMHLMDQFPAYSFTQSQPQLYDFVRQDYPYLFEKIKERVAEGRWEPIGGMWVEADCNISGPESLARQFLLGRNFFRNHFGAQAESPVMWLPDVFGYAWNLPQLIKLAGLEYFFTIKIGWNQTNQMPFDSFWWQGLDGTRVLTHFSTTPERPQDITAPDALFKTATYNANLSAFTALGSWAKLKHKESQQVMLMSYGYGDGGGGPTREMNENALELASFPALPRVKQGKVIDFFRQLEAESGDQLPIWNSELYLEIHRGTYTTQSRNKRANRKSEFLLHDAEYLATAASLVDSGYVYPKETFQRAWKLVCLNQFHDIIPGSSINPVYVESQEQYAEIQSITTTARDQAVEVIKATAGGDVVLINPTSFTREDLAFWEHPMPVGQRFAEDVYTQAAGNGTLVGGVSVDPYSATPLTFSAGEPNQPNSEQFPLQVAHNYLENAFIRVELNFEGDIIRIYDKQAQREVLPPGTIANQFQAFEDRPLNWDAWDIDIFYDDKQFLAAPAESIQVVESGPLRAAVEIKRRILNSSYTQRISLTYNCPQIDFETAINWQERHILLKAAFPSDVLSPKATYEVQWGHVERPTHRNTSWDWARFETCAQKWVDLSEGDYGIALLNDCKYGHDIHDNVIRISLLRSPTMPDPEADLDEHRFAYSLFPHSTGGSLPNNPVEIAHQAYSLNDPLIAVSGTGGSPKALPSLVRGSENIIIETVKQAEDGNGIIVRFYESNRQRGWINLQTGFPIQAAYITNLIEEDQETLEVEGQSVRLYVRPFQIVTLRLIPGIVNYGSGAG